MAKGTVDWYKGVDISYQTLSQLTQRPKYGAISRSYISGSIPPNATTTLIAVSGKGVLYGLYAYIDASATIDNDNMGAVIDGTTIDALTWKQLKDIDGYMPVSAVFWVSLYDDTNYNYAGQMAFGVTFESGFNIFYTETYGNSPTGSVWAYFGIIS